MARLGLMVGWGGVRERVESLAGVAVVGAEAHRFELAPPLGEAGVADLELYLGVRLTEDCRSFLATVSAGGAGPFYGLFPVQKTEGGCSWDGDGGDMTDIARLGQTFAPGDISAALTALDAVEPDEDDDDATEVWMEQRDAVIWDEARTVGAVCLCHEGCAYRDWLVVSGPQRGRVWSDDRTEAQRPSGTRA